MKACWNCAKTDLPERDDDCWHCGKFVPYVEPEPVYVRPRKRVVVPPPPPPPWVRALERLGDSVQKHRQAAGAIAALAAMVLFASFTEPPPPQPDVHWVSAQVARENEMWVRDATPSPRELKVKGRTVKVLAAWVAAVGRPRCASSMDARTRVFNTGRFRLYFTTPCDGAPVPRFRTGPAHTPVEILRNDAESPTAFLHSIPVNPGSAAPVTFTLGDATLTIR